MLNEETPKPVPKPRTGFEIFIDGMKAGFFATGVSFGLGFFAALGLSQAANRVEEDKKAMDVANPPACKCIQESVRKGPP